MTTNHLTAQQRDRVPLFLEGQGWGYGGQVDVTPTDPWNVPGRYGWVGGTGTTAEFTKAVHKHLSWSRWAITPEDERTGAEWGV